MRNIRRFVTLCILSPVLLWAVPETLLAQRTEKVTGKYTYVLPEDESESYGKEVALKRAQISAIEDVFGTVIAQQNATQIDTRGGYSSTNFSSISTSEVKGEWIQTLAEPKYYVERDSRDVTTITCEVRGLVREIVSAPVEFDAQILCNGTSPKFARSDFQDGDDLYLLFRAPSDGYVAVYLRDEQRNAFRLLPYPGANSGAQRVIANQQYVFFSHEKAPSDLAGITTAYHLTAEGSMEHNYIYVIFSPEAFSIAPDVSADPAHPANTLRMLSFLEYEKWIGSNRRHNPRMQVLEVPVTIRK
jgi:hypothetical protein